MITTTMMIMTPMPMQTPLVVTARGGDELLKEKKSRDGSFGDPLPKVGPSGSGHVAQLWTAAVTTSSGGRGQPISVHGRGGEGEPDQPR